MNARFKQIREKSGLNQKDFAEKLGTTQANISRYEKGELDLKTDMQRKLAEHFGVNIHWLVTGQGERTYSEQTQSISGDKNIQITNMQNSNITQFRSKDKIVDEIMQDVQRLPEKRREKIYHLIKAELTEL
jgi:transcriptional regulator with XRE-family HTH domain